MNSKILSVLVVALMCMAGVPAVCSALGSDDARVSSDAVPEDPEEYAEGRVLVKDAGFSEDSLNIDYASAEALCPGSDWFVVTLPEGADTAAAVDALRASGSFDDVCYDSIGHLEDTSAVAPGHAGTEYLDTMHIREAWEYLDGIGVPHGGLRDIVVAVIDTGTEITHPDLADNIWVNEDEIPGNGIDDDGNGYIDDVNGWNFISGSSEIHDYIGHGTHVSGIIAAEENDIGMVGVASNCRIMPLQCIGSWDDVRSSDIARCLYYAADNGADVANMSLGGDSSPVLDDAIAYASQKCVLVAAAGNSALCSNPCHSEMHHVLPVAPGVCQGVIGVMSASVEGDDLEVTYYSNYDDCPLCDEFDLDVYSFGDEVYSTDINGTYRNRQGTSMASPVIAGIAALVLSANPDMTPAEVAAAICTAGDSHPVKLFRDIDDYTDIYHSYCDASEAVSDARNAKVALSSFGTDDAQSLVRAGDNTLNIALKNMGFATDDVRVSLTTYNPFVTITDGTVDVGSVGTSTVTSVTEDGAPISFGFEVDDRINMNIPLCMTVTVTWNDGDAESSLSTDIELKVTCPADLPSVIDKDMTLTKAQDLFMNDDVTIAEGATLVLCPGTTLTMAAGTVMHVRGSLVCDGDLENRIVLACDGDGTALIERSASDSGTIFECCDMTDVLFGGDREGCTMSNIVFSGCNIELTDAEGEVMWLQNMISSDITASVGELDIGNAMYSAVILVSADRLCCDGLKDTVVAFDNAGGSCEFCIDGHLDGVMVTTVSDIGKDTVICDVDDSAVLDDICFGGSLTGAAPFETVPMEELRLENMYPMVQGVKFLSSSYEMIDYEPGMELPADEYQMMVKFTNKVVPDGLSIAADYYLGEHGMTDTIESYDEWCYDVWIVKLNESGSLMDTERSLYFDGWNDPRFGPRNLIPMHGGFPFTVPSEDYKDVELHAEDTSEGVHLFLTASSMDDVRTVTVYRSDSETGPGEAIGQMAGTADYYLYDTETEEGSTYWYHVTVTMKDGTELVPTEEAVRVDVADRTAPVITHDPLDSCKKGVDLTVSFTATDNVKLTSVIMKYRQSGETVWHFVVPQLADGVYSYTIPGDEVCGDGIEYFIAASDGFNMTYFGTSDDPVVVSVFTVNPVPISAGTVLVALFSVGLMLYFRRP